MTPRGRSLYVRLESEEWIPTPQQLAIAEERTREIRNDWAIRYARNLNLDVLVTSIYWQGVADMARVAAQRGLESSHEG